MRQLEGRATSISSSLPLCSDGIYENLAMRGRRIIYGQSKWVIKKHPYIHHR